MTNLKKVKEEIMFQKQIHVKNDVSHKWSNIVFGITRKWPKHCELDQAIFISLMTSVMSYMVDEKIQKMAKW